MQTSLFLELVAQPKKLKSVRTKIQAKRKIFLKWGNNLKNHLCLIDKESGGNVCLAWDRMDTFTFAAFWFQWCRNAKQNWRKFCPKSSVTWPRLNIRYEPQTPPTHRSNCTFCRLWSDRQPFIASHSITWLMFTLTSGTLRDHKQSAGRSFRFVFHSCWNPQLNASPFVGGTDARKKGGYFKPWKVGGEYERRE